MIKKYQVEAKDFDGADWILSVRARNLKEANQMAEVYYGAKGFKICGVYEMMYQKRGLIHE